MSTKITTTHNVELGTTEVELTKKENIDVNIGQEDVELVVQDSLIEGHKKEYSIVGDGLYASVNTDEAPQWLLGIIERLTDAAINRGYGNYDDLVQDVRNAIDSIDVAKNTYVEQIDIAHIVDGILASRLQTLNATLGNTYATKVELDTAVATATSSAVQSVTDLATGFNNTTNARITGVELAYADADSALSSNINVLSARVDDQQSDVEGNSNAISGLQTYVGVTETGNPDGTGILSSLSVLQKQNDGLIETFTGQHHVMFHDTDPDDGVDEEELRTNQWPYALWTPMEGTVDPTMTTRTAYIDTTPYSYPIEQYTVYHNTVDNTYWEYSINDGWEPIEEADFNVRKEVVRSSHVGDTFINYGYAADGVTREYNESLKFLKNSPDDTAPYNTDSEGYGWALVTDSDSEAAYIQALNAYDLADNKRRVFITPPGYDDNGGEDPYHPTGPYDAGDLWVDSNGTPQVVKTSTVDRAAGYVSGDWVQADQQANDFITGTYVADKTSIDNQLDGKIEYFFYDRAADVEVSPGVSAENEEEAKNAIKAPWDTAELKQENHGNVVYFKDSRNAYWYQSSTDSWLVLEDTSIYEALQNAAEAQSTADGKVSHYYAWFDPTNNDIPQSFDINVYQEVTNGDYVVNEDNTGYELANPADSGTHDLVTIDTVDEAGFRYWLKTTSTQGVYALYYRSTTGWELLTSVAEGDIVVCYDITILDQVAFTYQNGNWERTGVNGILAKSRSFTELENDIKGPTGFVAKAFSLSEETSRAYADEVSAEVENKFSYDSILKLGDSYYKSGFGLTSEGIAENLQSGNGESPSTAFDSEFWVRADRFVLTNADGSTKATFNVEDNAIKLGVEHTEATRNVPAGVYGSGTTYKAGDIVTYNNSSYVALKDTTVVPINDLVNWQLLAAQGESPVLLDIAPNESWPTNTTEAGAKVYTFHSTFSGNVIVKLLAHDAEGTAGGGVRLKFNDSEDIPFYRTLADNTQEWYEFVFDNLVGGDNQLKVWSTNGDGGSVKEIKVAFVGARGADGGYTDYLFTRKTTEPTNPGGADTWYTSVTSVPAGAGYLWSIKKVVGQNGTTTTYSDKRVIDAPIVRELLIYSEPVDGDVSVPQSSKYNFVTDTLSIGTIGANDTSWSTTIPSIGNNETIYVTSALVTGNDTQTAVSITWNTPSVYSKRKDGISITDITQAYQISNSASTAPTGSWKTTIAGAGALTDAKPYLWAKTTTSFTEGDDKVVTSLIAVKGSEGSSADTYKEVVLYQNKSSVPTELPTDTEGFSSTNGTASATGDWTTSISDLGSGEKTYRINITLRQVKSTGAWSAVDDNWNGPVAVSGSDGGTYREIFLYKNSSSIPDPVVNLAPTDPFYGTSAILYYDNTEGVSKSRNGWEPEPTSPSEGEFTYRSSFTIFKPGGFDQWVRASAWSAPIRLTGDKGDKGENAPIAWGARLTYTDLAGYAISGNSTYNLPFPSDSGDYTFYGGDCVLSLTSAGVYNASNSVANSIGYSSTSYVDSNVKYLLIRDPSEESVYNKEVLNRVESGTTWIRFNGPPSSNREPTITRVINVASRVYGDYTYYLFTLDYVSGSMTAGSAIDNIVVTFDFTLADSLPGAGFYSATVNPIATTTAAITKNFVNATGRGPVAGDVFTQSHSSYPTSDTKRFNGENWVDPAAIIDGDLIVDGSITARHIAANEISANYASLGVITAGRLQSETDLSTSKFVIDLDNERIEIKDGSGAVRVRLGKL
jgi:hypothetical protein